MATLFEYYNTGDDGQDSIYGVYWNGQTFTPATAHKITSVKLLLFRTGSPGEVIVSIQGVDGSDHPDGNDLCSGTTDGDTLPTGSPYEWREITLGAGSDLDADTKYAIVVRALDGNSGNCIKWRNDTTTPTYAGGCRELSLNSGSSWTSYTGVDYMFEDWGEPAVTEKTSSDTGSGVDATVALLATLVKSDSGSGVDAFTGNRDFILPDAGVGVEALGDRDFGAAEVGIGEELASLLAERIRADTGMGIDAVISFLTSVSKFGTDSGIGADVAVLKAFLDRLDTGSGVEAILSRDIVKAETGVGIDIAALLATFVKSDAGTGLDQGEKLLIDQILQAVDSGVGVDVAVVRCIGKAMKLITYTKPYSDLVVYTKPHSDLKVYTSEVKQ